MDGIMMALWLGDSAGGGRVHYDVCVWPLYLIFAGIVAGGILVIVIAALGIKALLRRRRDRMDNA